MDSILSGVVEGDGMDWDVAIFPAELPCGGCDEAELKGGSAISRLGAGFWLPSE